MINFNLGLDLGQVNDPTAIAIVEKIKEPTGERITTVRRRWTGGAGGARFGETTDVTVDKFHLRYLQRLPLGTSYPDIVRHVQEMLQRPELAKKTQLVVDATGVGRPVVDLLREAQINPMIAVTITGG